MYLDSLTLVHAQVGYGCLGRDGDLGYEGKRIIVAGTHYSHALSTHPPASITFRIDKAYSSFRCKVALNDDVSRQATHADFSVLVDNRLVAHAPYVKAGSPPREIVADISNGEILQLRVETGSWEFSHAVWLEPEVEKFNAASSCSSLMDCLDRSEIILPQIELKSHHCIATVVSPGFEDLLDDLLGSLLAYGCCQDALIVVFGVDANDQCKQIAAKYSANFVACKKQKPVNSTVKSILYSVPRIVDADSFICLDADMLVLGSLRPVFDAIEACPKKTILACREANGMAFKNLEHALCSVYGGRASDLANLLGTPNGAGAYSFVVNDGLFAGSRSALLALDGMIRGFTNAPKWIDERRDIWWRNQFIFNLALAQLECGVELEPIYNVQLNSQDVQMKFQEGQVMAYWYGRRASVLHFNGLGRYKYPEYRNIFSRVKDPLVGRVTGDAYGIFLERMRAWIGRHGTKAMAWTFYGTSDALSAKVKDPSVMPLLALLHYIIRSNGCVKVLESGTARGVSAACIASAISHRQNGQVVTFDPADFPERSDLWASLPASMRSCIDYRQVDALEGMSECVKKGEVYHAALLDSLHSADHVLSEFQLASKLVCPGGLVLIHDVRTQGSSVEEALELIQQSGYGVVRLWTADDGEMEDDCLGLALIENRRR